MTLVALKSNARDLANEINAAHLEIESASKGMIEKAFVVATPRHAGPSRKNHAVVTGPNIIAEHEK
jgi:hypothetical protein